MIILFDLDYTLFDTAQFKKDVVIIFGLDFIKGRSKNKNLSLDIEKYIFPGVRNLLEELKSAGHTLILFSYGNKEFQNNKICNLNIKKYFSKIIVTDRKKDKSLTFLKRAQDKILIVNDNALESIAMRNELKQSEIFLIKGPYSRNVKHALKTRAIGELNKFL